MSTSDLDPQNQPASTDVPTCDCNADAFVVLPPELQPRPKSWQEGLRKVTCPGCDLVFWTNSESDYCTACRPAGLHRPESI